MSATSRHRWIALSWLVLASPALHADTFFSAYYDPTSNELVVTMSYRGTNPDHQFSVQWGACQAPRDGKTSQQIAGDILDSQWNDLAQSTFTKTVRFSLANLNCRPATVTLRTPPRFEYTLQIP
jgi:hypothetical protein